MPVPKTGDLPLGDSPIPVSSPAAAWKTPRRAPESPNLLGARERLAREDPPSCLGAQTVARTLRFPLAFKDAEQARPAARKRRASRARLNKRSARALDLRLKPRHDGLEIVRHDLTERTGKFGLRARNRQVNDPLILCQGGRVQRFVSLRGRD